MTEGVSDAVAASERELERHREQLLACRRCPAMVGPVVAPPAVASKILLVGQAPGPHEGKYGKPFAWTAGKTLFSWFSRLGLDEEGFRNSIYMAAVCRCFPGKAKQGGDRVPSHEEIRNCSHWLRAEVELLQPELVLPVGKLGISQLLPVKKLVDVVGRCWTTAMFGHQVDVIPLPHPSGASTWHRTEPGKTLLQQALDEIGAHATFRAAVERVSVPVNSEDDS